MNFEWTISSDANKLYELWMNFSWSSDELQMNSIIGGHERIKRVHTQFMSCELVFIWSSWGWELWFIRSSWKFEEFIGELVWGKRSYRVHSFLDPPGSKKVMSSSMSFLVRFIWSSYSYELSLWTPFELQWWLRPIISFWRNDESSNT